MSIVKKIIKRIDKFMGSTAGMFWFVAFPAWAILTLTAIKLAMIK